MTMQKGRRKFTGEEKMVILRRHLAEKVPVSDVCDEVGIHPTLFYRWQKELFENGAAAFARRCPGGMREADLPSLHDGCTELQRIMV